MHHGNKQRHVRLNWDQIETQTRSADASGADEGEEVDDGSYIVKLWFDCDKIIYFTKTTAGEVSRGPKYDRAIFCAYRAFVIFCNHLKNENKKIREIVEKTGKDARRAISRPNSTDNVKCFLFSVSMGIIDETE